MADDELTGAEITQRRHEGSDVDKNSSKLTDQQDDLLSKAVEKSNHASSKTSHDTKERLRNQRGSMESDRSHKRGSNYNASEFSGPQMTLANIIGEFGWYQLSAVALAFIRYLCVAMMTNTGPLIAPDVNYTCTVPDNIVQRILKPDNVTLNEFLLKKCSLDLIGGTKNSTKSEYQCTSWTYDTSKSGVTLTDSFDLVCDRDWLRSAFQSSITIGVAIASIVWGSFSDLHGRYFSIKVCSLLSLILGSISFLATDLATYTISRSLCSFSDLGLAVSLSILVVEMLGNKFRGAMLLIVYTGWAIGVMIMPWLVDYFRDFKRLTQFTVLCHTITLPWILTMDESIRWLLVNGKMTEALEAVKRIIKFNLKGSPESLKEANEKFAILGKKFERKAALEIIDFEESTQGKKSKSIYRVVIVSLFGGFFKISDLFSARELTICTLTLIWITFNSELFYMFTVLLNSDVGSNTKLNYAIGGCVETLATIINMVIISKISRKLSLRVTLISLALLVFTLAFTFENEVVASWVLNLAKLAVSTLSSLVYVTGTEIFPTYLRQTGSGITGTISSLGGVVAPFVRKELVDLIGMKNVLLILAVMPLSALVVVPLLRETKGHEIPDDMDDIDSS